MRTISLTPSLPALANLIVWLSAWTTMRDCLNQYDAGMVLTPGPFVFAAFLMLAVAVTAVAGHAIRVAPMSPIHALRYE